MPWGRLDDRLAMSVKIRGLADPGVTGERAKRQRAEALGVWTQVLSWVSGERSNGFVTADIVDLFGWPAAVERLLRARFDRAPLLHRREDGEACECMEGRAWPADYEYLIHDYLDRNPARDENDVHRAKLRERKKDPELRAAVWTRDAGHCRYCDIEMNLNDKRSPHRPVLDHVDPTVAAGAINLVSACHSCNARKNNRTPEAAGMVLLPARNPIPEIPNPSTVFDTDPESDLNPDLDPDSKPTTDTTTDRGPDPGSVPHVSSQTSAGTCDATGNGRTAGRGREGKGGRSGPGPAGYAGPNGQRSTVGPATTPRRTLSPSPYSHLSRPLPEHHAGAPPPDEYRWPPGSVPATPRRPGEHDDQEGPAP